MLTASIIIPTHNKVEYLDLTLASFHAQTSNAFEIIVAADGCTDDTMEIANKHAVRLPITIVSMPHSGRARARNAALAAARGSVVVFSDDDRLVAPSFVETHLASHCEAPPHVGLGTMRAVLSFIDSEEVGNLIAPLSRRLGVTPTDRGVIRLVTPSDVVGDFAHVVDTLAFPEPDWERKMQPFSAYALGELMGPLGWFAASTGNMSVLREHLERICGFDERFAGYGMEDTDLAYRLNSVGIPCRKVDALSFHQRHSRQDTSRQLSMNLRRFVDIHSSLGAILFERWFCGAISFATAEALYGTR